MRSARVPVLALSAATVIALAGCGGSNSGSSNGQAAASGNSDQLAAFRKCMQAHGATPPGNGRRPQGSGSQGQSTNRQPPAGRPPLSSAQREKLQKAMTACRDKLPQGAGPPGGQGPGGGSGPPGAGPPTGGAPPAS